MADGSEAPDGLMDGYATICTPSQDAVLHEEIARMEAAFAELPDDYQEVITLSRLIGFSHTEIAEKMDKTPGNVRVLSHRAVARLASILAE
jgi:RNA polymerase sigma factor (sigma-70 family)